MYIVTGGAGFIGSNIIAGLEKEFDEEVVIIDCSITNAKWKNLCKRKNIKTIITSYAEAKDYLYSHKSEIKAFFHMGEVFDKNDNVNELIEDNFKLSQGLWDFCTENNIPFIYNSSYRTYGYDAEDFSDNFSIDALSSLCPDDPYSWSKNLFDISVARSVLKHKKSPPQWVGLKFFSAYGPNEYHKETKKSLITKAYPFAVQNKSFTLYKSENEKYSDGKQMRDFIYVKDCVDVVLWFLKNPDVSGLYNVGTGLARTFYDMAVSLYKTIGIEPKIKYDDIPAEMVEKYQYFTEANILKLRDAGYTKPFTSLEDGVRDFVLNYLHTSDPYI